MSRILVFDEHNKLAGEFSRPLDRGWMLTGNPLVTGGGETSLELTNEIAAQKYLQFGRMVMVQHESLPAWTGMIDTPWNGTPPVQMSLYNAEYLLNLRTPDEPVFIEGSISTIVGRMLEMFNAQEDLFVRLGEVSQADTTPRQETLDGRTYWEQLKALLQRAGCEMQARPVKDADGQLVIYLDIATQLGTETGFLYSDGEDGNAVFRDFALDGKITNRVIGISDGNGVDSRIRTDPLLDETSQGLYRLRSEIVQFRDVAQQSTLDRYSQTYLDYAAYPHLAFLMDIQDSGQAFRNARLGNVVRVHAANVILPGGVQGWEGTARILAMAYTESSNQLTASMEAV